MNPAAASTAKSLLEKPLSQLTEDDIGQITREECRRFLKERGMRRPSWNKSQAIQQVISLKALLEDCADPEDLTSAIRIRRKHLSPPVLTPLQSSQLSPTEASGSGDSRSAPTPGKDPSPYRRKDPISPVFTVGDAPRLIPAAKRPQPTPEVLCPPPRAAAEVPAGQLTIFYGGKVNVYEAIPSDKAREIFQLAASPDPFDASTLATVPSGRSFLPRFSPAYTGPTTDRGPVADPGAYPNAPEGKQQRSFKDNLEGGNALREPVPGKRAELEMKVQGGHNK